jgi:hypothetical protein
MDVLRAVAERLADGDPEAVGPDGAHDAVLAVAPPRGELDAEDPDRRAQDERVPRRIDRIGRDGDGQRPRVRGRHEARRTREDRRQRPRGVAPRHDDERQLRKEGAVLLGHELADTAAVRDRAGRAHLRGQLASVKGR